MVTSYRLQYVNFSRLPYKRDILSVTLSPGITDRALLRISLRITPGCSRHRHISLHPPYRISSQHHHRFYFIFRTRQHTTASTSDYCSISLQARCSSIFALPNKVYLVTGLSMICSIYYYSIVDATCFVIGCPSFLSALTLAAVFLDSLRGPYIQASDVSWTAVTLTPRRTAPDLSR